MSNIKKQMFRSGTEIEQQLVPSLSSLSIVSWIWCSDGLRYFYLLNLSDLGKEISGMVLLVFCGLEILLVSVGKLLLSPE